MDGERNSDPSIEQALTREGTEWRKEAPPSGSTCVDAETLARWSEGTLPAVDALAVEIHVADCARCQEVAATFARTEPEVVTATLPARAPWLQRWWLPLAGGLVTATLLIVAVTRRSDIATPQPEAVTAKVETPAAPAGTASPKTAAAPPVTAPSAKPAPAATEPAPLAIAPPPAAAPPPPVPPPPQQTSAPARPPVGMVGGVAGGVVGGVSAGAVRGVASATASGASTSARAEISPATRAAWAEPELVEFRSPIAGGPGGGFRAGGGGGVNTAALSLVPPGPQTRWRFVRASANLERSTDNGGSWQLVSVGDTSIALIAGAAPSRLTCWLVGRAGVVLLSTDAVTFTRVAFPEAVDLVAVTSTDPLHATIIAADGRQFTTDDGGKIWK